MKVIDAPVQAPETVEPRAPQEVEEPLRPHRVLLADVTRWQDMPRMNPVERERWLVALRSGARQGRYTWSRNVMGGWVEPACEHDLPGALRRDRAYCAIGLYGGVREDVMRDGDGFEWLEDVGARADFLDRVVDWNDTWCFTFPQIADMVEHFL